MYFDKEKFSEILIKIKNSYGSINQMADKTGVTAAYISKLIRQLYSNAPSPEILKKISEASKDITTYEELMQICGYNKIQELTPNLFADVITENEWELIFGKFDKIVLTENEQLAYYAIIDNLNNTEDTNNEYCEIEFNSDNYTKYGKSKNEKDIILRIFFYLLLVISKRIDNTELYKNVINVLNSLPKLEISSKNDIHSSYYNCPVYGQISAGLPNWAEECLEGYLPIDPNLMNIINPEECFFLRVNGESMNKIIKNGAYALIRKQDIVENGDIAAVLVNGNDATIKKFTRQNELVILEPMSDDDNFKLQIYDKNTSIKILGKYIGKFEINN